jgi:hypothetical protein
MSSRVLLFRIETHTHFGLFASSHIFSPLFIFELIYVHNDCDNTEHISFITFHIILILLIFCEVYSQRRHYLKYEKNVVQIFIKQQQHQEQPNDIINKKGILLEG